MTSARPSLTMRSAPRVLRMCQRQVSCATNEIRPRRLTLCSAPDLVQRSQIDCGRPSVARTLRGLPQVGSCGWSCPIRTTGSMPPNGRRDTRRRASLRMRGDAALTRSRRRRPLASSLARIARPPRRLMLLDQMKLGHSICRERCENMRQESTKSPIENSAAIAARPATPMKALLSTRRVRVGSISCELLDVI